MKKIPDNVLENLLNYLATRPYNEVFKLIQTLLTLEEIKDKPKK